MQSKVKKEEITHAIGFRFLGQVYDEEWLLQQTNQYERMGWKLFKNDDKEVTFICPENKWYHTWIKPDGLFYSYNQNMLDKISNMKEGKKIDGHLQKE